MGKKLNLDIELIKKMYVEDKLSSDKIAEKLGCSIHFILQILKESNIKIKGSGGFRKKILDIGLIKKMYVEDKFSFIKIAKKVGCSDCTIRNRLKEIGIVVRGERKEKIDLDIELIKKLYVDERLSCEKIARKLGWSNTTISRILIKNGINIKEFYDKRWDIKLIRKLYSEERLSYKAIAIRLNANSSIIRNIIIKNNIKKKILDLDLMKILYLEDRLNPNEIAIKLDFSESYIRKRLREANVELRSISEARRRLSDINLIIRMYLNDKLSASEISRKVSWGKTTILKRLHENNIKIRDGLIDLKEDKDKIISLYKKGYTIEEIGDLYNCSREVIRKRLILWGVKLRPSFYEKIQKLICDDGHIVKSSMERQVDNYLFHHQISHQYEARLCSNSGRKCDFKVGEYFIEVWGLIGIDEYEDRMKEKIEIYRKNNLKLISIFPKDNIHKKLSFLIPLFSKVQKQIIDFETEGGTIKVIKDEN